MEAHMGPRASIAYIKGARVSVPGESSVPSTCLYGDTE